MEKNFNRLLLLKGFNNYFNRIIKKYSTTSDYIDNSSDYHYVENVNFNPNDGVQAGVILNIQEDLSKSDYLLVLSGEDIVSRWYIMEVERLRKGQYRITLKRDVIAENLENLRTAPLFVEKSIIRDKADPFIFNKENMGYNQIKKNEEYLKDKSRVPWIVGYISRDYLKQTDPEQAETDKEISAKYALLSDSAVPSSQLPWEFTDQRLILGNCQGYELKVKYGHADYVVSRTYQGVTYTSKYPFTADFSLQYDSNGNYSGYTGSTNYPSVSQGQFFLYNTSDGKFNIVATQNKGRPSVKDFVNTIVNNNLSLKQVPNSIVTATISTDATVQELLSWNNKVIVHAGRYYQLKVKETTTDVQEFPASSYFDLRDSFAEFISTYNDINDGLFGLSDIAQASLPLVMTAQMKGVVIEPTEVSTVDIKMTVPRYSRRAHLNDAPYDMFAIPFASKNLYNEEKHRLHLATADIDCDENVSLAMAFYCAAEMGKDVVYDIQLLPFCPCQEFITDDGVLTESYGVSGYNYSYITNASNEKLSICLWCNSSSSSFNIEKAIDVERPTTTETVSRTYTSNLLNMYSGTYSFNGVESTISINNVGRPGINTVFRINSISIRDEQLNISDITQSSFNGNNLVIKTRQVLSDIVQLRPVVINRIRVDMVYVNTQDQERYIYNEAEDIKVSNECDFFRLSSPNYNGQFEFSVAKNGSVEFFNVDYTYKPFQPYIHINPNFKELYGSDFNDARGLICGGDFSLPIITSAWTDYEVANKNYNNVFLRQIQNMETNYKIQRKKDIASAVSGVFTGAASGAVSAGMASGGNPYAAAAGALVGGTMSAIGGGMDVELNKEAYQESKKYAEDMYGFNVGNIEAIPYALARTSAFTENNKIFPVLESYSCTDKEKSALRNKIKYNGMTVMRIDTIDTFLDNEEETYIQGDLIRDVSLMDDFHMFNECYTELKKGVYL